MKIRKSNSKHTPESMMKVEVIAGELYDTITDLEVINAVMKTKNAQLAIDKGIVVLAGNGSAVRRYLSPSLIAALTSNN
jgi:hypothetical protein